VTGSVNLSVSPAPRQLGLHGPAWSPRLVGSHFSQGDHGDFKSLARCPKYGTLSGEEWEAVSELEEIGFLLDDTTEDF
jgi:hypothetical protein